MMYIKKLCALFNTIAITIEILTAIRATVKIIAPVWHVHFKNPDSGKGCLTEKGHSSHHETEC